MATKTIPAPSYPEFKTRTCHSVAVLSPSSVQSSNICAPTSLFPAAYSPYLEPFPCPSDSHNCLGQCFWQFSLGLCNRCVHICCRVCIKVYLYHACSHYSSRLYHTVGMPCACSSLCLLLVFRCEPILERHIWMHLLLEIVTMFLSYVELTLDQITNSNLDYKQDEYSIAQLTALPPS